MSDRTVPELLRELGAKSARDVKIGRIDPTMRRACQATITALRDDRIWLESGGAKRLSDAHAIGALLRVIAPGGRMRDAGGYLNLIDRARDCIAVSDGGRPGDAYCFPLAWCAGDTIYFDPEEA